jgi:hypothetical protein
MAPSTRTGGLMPAIDLTIPRASVPQLPDYRGGGIVNLMASIIGSRGGRADHPQLAILPAAELAGANNLVLLVIDGLGDDWLCRRAPGGLLARHRLGSMTTVFPSTTATAITTFLTGDPPLAHGLTGWYTWMGELGAVISVLPGVPRYGGVSYSRAGIDPVRLFGHRPVFDRIVDPSWAVTPEQIAGSDFNRAHTGRAQVVAFRGLEGLFRTAARILRKERGRKYLYLYWPELDSIGHRQGMETVATAIHLGQIERVLEWFLRRIAGRDTLVLVTGDHGQVDTGPADVIDLAAHPELADCLALPLCGEPRAAFAYLRAGRESRFLGYCRDVLSDRIELKSSAALTAEGYFGDGRAHPRFAERIGDWCLLPKGRGVVRHRLPFEEPHVLVGQHGGLTETELRVPLCVLRS